MKLRIKNGELKIRNTKIDLRGIKSNRLCISAFTSLGKSRFVDILIAQSYSNVKIFSDDVLIDNDFIKIQDTVEFVVLDDCTFDKKYENRIKEFIIKDTKRLYIIIGRKIFMPGINCLDFLNIGNQVIVQNRLSLKTFERRFNNFKYQKEKVNVILTEDSKSGFYFMKKLFNDAKVLTTFGVSNTNKIITSVNEKYNYPNIFLCLDYVPDNPEVLDDLNKLDIANNIFYLNSHTIEELLFIDYESEYLYFDYIQHEIYNKENDIAKNPEVYLDNLESRSFESLLTSILAKTMKYQKSNKIKISNKNNILRDIILKYSLYNKTLNEHLKTNNFK